MPLPIPASQSETPLRRQVSRFSISIAPMVGDQPDPIPTLQAEVDFIDVYRNAEGLPVVYPVQQRVQISGADLLALPDAGTILAALQGIAYAKAIEQGLNR